MERTIRGVMKEKFPLWEYHRVMHSRIYNPAMGTKQIPMKLRSFILQRAFFSLTK
ncbi:MAG: hypothetical protein ACI3V2_00990 [Faecousia sp.]